MNSAPWYDIVGLNGLKEEIDQPLIPSAPMDMTYGGGWRGRHFFTMPGHRDVDQARLRVHRPVGGLTAFNPGNWVDPIYTVQGGWRP
ncbi:hypothetical protein AB0F91_15150 [Amycolatopsis sp. NPDC023774]|uniref:hypothetical protein n=1 Tax=Amycolatopsis sp. NPDC023774 TaxID=3155015 RepID=UPI0033E5B506